MNDPRPGAQAEATVARDYFRSEDDFRDYVKAAAANARNKHEKSFTEDIGRRAARWGMGTRITSNQAAWLTRIARRPARTPQTGAASCP